MELFRSNTAALAQPRNSSIINQTGPWSQVMIGLLVPFVIYLVLAGLEASYNMLHRLKMNRTELLPITYSTEEKSYTINQNPNSPNSSSIYLSDNERSGPEFSYSFFLMVHPSAFRQEKGLNHIFHKGSPRQYPLLGPGVYMRSDTNILRVYMNTYGTWNKYTEIDNFPIGKWVHVALVCRSTHMEIYINGNLKKRLGFEGSLPYQNYQDIMAFRQDRVTLPKTVRSLEDEDSFDIFGVMKGMLSRLYYFNYALSYSEITMLMNEGPSTEIAGAQGGVMPQYLQDSWWTSQ
uniref:LamG-like jellyroll fold domain-containing protein n=1 Tax=viral metagenome TaxID=1070528 RepID=A0A6C0DGA4_9ZZZZ